ncbi:MAG: hypothetical protein K5657_10490 [Desulfovibrio sp.]|nr:hypothetical protein [Desulfovibrio sp.]
MSKENAEKIFNETHTIYIQTGNTGESSYIKEENILKAALFGAYDAKIHFLDEQDRLREAGKPLHPDSFPLLNEGGRIFTADMVQFKWDNADPDLFNEIPEIYDIFISRDAVEIAALHFTGHTLKKHISLKGEEFLDDTLTTEKGYYIIVEALGDTYYTSTLENIQKEKDGFVLTGKIKEKPGGDENLAKTVAFRLRLFPGEVSGTWKREYSETTLK